MSYWEAKGLSDDWFTPQAVFDALGCQFDLDVAGRPEPANCVPATDMIEHESLETPWRGFIWMNPPFGGRNGLSPWLDKFIAHGNGIALTPDRTSAPWFQVALPQMDAVLFTRKIRFLRPEGAEGVSPSNGTALMAMGWQGAVALNRAAGLGFGALVSPMRSYLAPRTAA